GGRGGSRSRRAHRWRMRGKEGAVSDSKRIRLARAAYDAYVTGDRGVLEELLSEDFTFSSPYDVGIDRRAYFERCWPNAELISGYEFKRLVESGDEVVVTYEATK